MGLSKKELLIKTKSSLSEAEALKLPPSQKGGDSAEWPRRQAGPWGWARTWGWGQHRTAPGSQNRSRSCDFKIRLQGLREFEKPARGNQVSAQATCHINAEHFPPVIFRSHLLFPMGQNAVTAVSQLSEMLGGSRRSPYAAAQTQAEQRLRKRPRHGNGWTTSSDARARPAGPRRRGWGAAREFRVGERQAQSKGSCRRAEGGAGRPRPKSSVAERKPGQALCRLAQQKPRTSSARCPPAVRPGPVGRPSLPSQDQDLFLGVALRPRLLLLLAARRVLPGSVLRLAPLHVLQLPLALPLLVLQLTAESAQPPPGRAGGAGRGTGTDKGTHTRSGETARLTHRRRCDVT